jgi:hypothetical protein
MGFCELRDELRTEMRLCSRSVHQLIGHKNNLFKEELLRSEHEIQNAAIRIRQPGDRIRRRRFSRNVVQFGRFAHGDLLAARA